jgi:hypothetical protein
MSSNFVFAGPQWLLAGMDVILKILRTHLSGPKMHRAPPRAKQMNCADFTT